MRLSITAKYAFKAGAAIILIGCVLIGTQMRYWPHIFFIGLPDDAAISYGYTSTDSLERLNDIAENIALSPETRKSKDDIFVVILRYEGPRLLSCKINISIPGRLNETTTLTVHRNKTSFLAIKTIPYEKEDAQPRIKILAVYLK